MVPVQADLWFVEVVLPFIQECGTEAIHGPGAVHVPVLLAFVALRNVTDVFVPVTTFLSELVKDISGTVAVFVQGQHFFGENLLGKLVAVSGQVLLVERLSMALGSAEGVKLKTVSVGEGIAGAEIIGPGISPGTVAEAVARFTHDVSGQGQLVADQAGVQA